MEEKQHNIVLITKHYFFKQRIKNRIKSILGINKKFGPEEVSDVLFEYKKHSALNNSIEINKGIKKSSIVFAEGLNELELNFIVKLKQKYKFKLIIHHGFSHPKELHNSQILNKVDYILVPSEWVRNLFNSEDSSLGRKVISFAWPCYEHKVNQINLRKDKPKNCLIFDKSEGFDIDNDFSDLINKTTSKLLKYGINVTVIKYKHYKNDDYLKILAKTDMMVYLSNQETQGLAQMQAWRNNVPTITYDRGIAKWANVICPGSSVPYFNELVGEIFTDISNFESVLNNFINKYITYNPQIYYEKYFSYKAIFPKIDILLLTSLKNEDITY